MLQLNYRDPRPIYEQVKSEFRRLILSGALPRGEKLPSVRELAGSLAINPNTIQRAYRELETEGCIISMPGKGSFVADAADIARQKHQAAEQARQALADLRALGCSAEELDALYAQMRESWSHDPSTEYHQIVRRLPRAGRFKLHRAARRGLRTRRAKRRGQIHGAPLHHGHLPARCRFGRGRGLPVWENPAVKRRMAFIPDDLSAHAGDSIREMAGLMQKALSPASTSAAMGSCAVFQLDEKKPLRRFSKGMQKQAAFWLAICAKPDYLILDEPVDGLDP